MTTHPPRLFVQVLGILLTALAMPATPLNAQLLVPDARVQVRQCPPKGVPGLCLTRQGAFQSLDGDSLNLRDSSGVLSSVAWTPATRVRVSRGKRGYAGHGAALGLLVGIIVGKAAASPSCDEHSDPPCGMDALIGAGVGLPLGALIGAVARTDRWVAVERPRAPSGLSFATVSLRLPTRTTAAGIELRYQF